MNDEKGKIIQKINEIMKLSYPHCNTSNAELSKIFYKINNLAYGAKKHLKSLDVKN